MIVGIRDSSSSHPSRRHPLTDRQQSTQAVVKLTCSATAGARQAINIHLQAVCVPSEFTAACANKLRRAEQ